MCIYFLTFLIPTKTGINLSKVGRKENYTIFVIKIINSLRPSQCAQVFKVAPSLCSEHAHEGNKFYHYF